MTGRTWIYTGLGVFLAVVLFPIWHGALNSEVPVAPELEYPEEAACIESAEYMRANHPALLNEWRDAAVRDGEIEYISTTGERHTMSLTGTCMECHQSKETFCVRCHEYADVNPDCWSCHVEP
jgi:hypothetical protein